MTTRRYISSGAVLLFLAGVLITCSSGKGAFRRGDYSSAVFSAVQRLRQNPTHRKSKSVLQVSYAMAVQFFDTEAQNLITSNQPFKWRSALANYEQINRMHDEIRTAPGALAVVPNPENRFRQAEELKLKAADEAYEAGILAMMKDTRASYREAHGLFEETNRLAYGHREAVEMQEQARENATLFVIVAPTRRLDDSDGLQNFQQDLQSCNRPFLKFFAAQPDVLAKYTLWIDSEVTEFNERTPQSSRSESVFRDSVRVGEKKVGTQTVGIFEKVSAKANIFTKTFRADGGLKVIAYGPKNEVAFTRTFEQSAEESFSWATFSGDERALPERIRRLAKQREPGGSRVRQTLHQEIEKDIKNTYCTFLANY